MAAAPPAPPIPQQKRKHTAVIPGTGDGFFVEVVGESFYQSELRTLMGIAGKDTVRVLLHPEPENPHDTNAVAVKTFEGAMLGYLSRDDAPKYQKQLLALRDRGQTGICNARLHGGEEDKPNVGIRLDIETPARVSRALELAKA